MFDNRAHSSDWLDVGVDLWELRSAAEMGRMDCFCKLSVARCVINFHFESGTNSEIAIDSNHGGVQGGCHRASLRAFC